MFQAWCWISPGNNKRFFSSFCLFVCYSETLVCFFSLEMSSVGLYVPLTTSCRLPHLWPGKTSNCFSRLGHKSHRPGRNKELRLLNWWAKVEVEHTKQEKHFLPLGLSLVSNSKSLTGLSGKLYT